MKKPRLPARKDEEQPSLLGGKLEDIPQPILRLFPQARRKRIVTICFTHYAGIGKHVYADVKEEDNPVWNGERWAEPWHDHEGAGERFSQAFVDSDMSVAYNNAAKWAQGIVEEHFPVATHKPIKAGDDLYVARPRRWHYKDGD